MIKAFPVILFILCMGFSGLQAEVRADSYLMTYERFVHLSDKEKEEVIVKTMEFVVELESKYKYEVRTSGYSQERFEKYVKALQNIQSFLLSSAHAQSTRDHFQTFSNRIANANPGSVCLYAGWISRINHDGLCAHPARVDGQVSRDFEGQAGCAAPANITCNPAIFGYKSSEQKTLFCAPAGRTPTDNPSENSAMSCMRQALQVEALPAGQDTRERRIEVIRGNLSANPDYVNNINQFIFKTCICDPATTESKVNRSYLTRIQPHRTCYGMMNMIGASNSCEDQPSLINTDLFQNMQTAIAESSADYSAYDGLYSSFLSQVRGSNGNQPHQEYAELCGLPTTPTTTTTTTTTGGSDEPTFTCIANCRPVPENTENPWICSFAITAPPGVNISQPADAEINARPGENLIVSLVNSDTNTTIEGQVCDVEITESDDPAGPSCTVALTRSEEEVTATATINTENTSYAEATPSIEWSAGHTAAEGMTATYPFSSELSVSASVSFTNPASNEAITCVVSDLTDDDDESTDDSAIPTLNVTGAAVTPTNRTANATLNDATETVAGYYIIWYREGAPAELAVPNTTSASSSRTVQGRASDGDGQAEDGDEEADDEATTTSTPASGEFSRNQFSVTEVRALTDYRVCAKLMKDDNTATGQSGCVDIPKLPVRATPNGAAGGPMMQSGQPMGGMPTGLSNTSAQGIR